MPEPIPYRDGAAELVGLIERPVAPNGRGVLVVHEIDGIGRNVRRRARMLADLGYTAFVADLYGGGLSYEGEAARAQMEALTADTAAFRRRVAAGLERLCEEPGVRAREVAAIGYCFGGLAVLELARSGADLAAAISFHGLLRSPAPARSGS
jgi:dienelactone hydrolase